MREIDSGQQILRHADECGHSGLTATSSFNTRVAMSCGRTLTIVSTMPIPTAPPTLRMKLSSPLAFANAPEGNSSNATLVTGKIQNSTRRRARFAVRSNR